MNKECRSYYQRYGDDDEKKSIFYTHPTEELSYMVRRRGAESFSQPIPLNELRSALIGRPELHELLEKRIQDLESIISMEFDPKYLQCATLYLRKERRGSRYLIKIRPCYSYSTFLEHRKCGGFPASNGMISTLQLPLYLTSNHALSFRIFFNETFAQIFDADAENSKTQWCDLRVANTLAHLINLAILDFAQGNIIEPAVQFVLDVLRLSIFYFEAPGYGEERAFLAGEEHYRRYFPNALSVKKSFLRNFITNPFARTRDVVPDLGDLLQSLAVIELMDSKNQKTCRADMIKWKDLAPAFVTELFRRQARWFCENFNHGRNCEPGTQETRANTQVVLRYVENLPKQNLLAQWWAQQKDSLCLIMYSYAFYANLVEGQSLDAFKSKYDIVLGAAYPQDIAAIKQAEKEIMHQQNLSDFFHFVKWPQSDDDIHRLLLWAIKANEEYNSGLPPPQMNDFKKRQPPPHSRRRYSYKRQKRGPCRYGSRCTRADCWFEHPDHSV